MKKMFIAILPLFLLANDTNCTKCSLNKSEMQCNYYVAKMADSSKAKYCKEYADYLNLTKVYGKAAWYYLLSLEPQNAIQAAQKAVEMGENYAYEYIADAYLIKGDKAKAKEYYKKFKENVGNVNFFIERNFKVLDKIYKEFNKKEAMSFLKD